MNIGFSFCLATLLLQVSLLRSHMVLVQWVIIRAISMLKVSLLLALALLVFSPDWATLTAIMSWLDFCFDWILRACLEFGFYTITKCFGSHSYWWFFFSLIDQGPPHGSAWWLLFWWGHPDSAGPFPCLKNGPLLMSSERCTRPFTCNRCILSTFINLSLFTYGFIFLPLQWQTLVLDQILGFSFIFSCVKTMQNS